MHEYVEIQFRRKGKPFRVTRQLEHGFEFNEADPPVRTIDIGFSPVDDGTRYRMQRIRQLRGWDGQRFDLNVSVEDGSLVLRGADKYSLPEGWYSVTANVSGTAVKKTDKRRVEVVHDKHGVVTMDLEVDDRDIEVDLESADPAIRRVLEASALDGMAGLEWVESPDVRATRRACALNLLATLRVTPTRSRPLLGDVECLILGKDDRSYAKVTPAFYSRVLELSESNDKVYPEGRPHARIHEKLLEAVAAFDGATAGCFNANNLWSFRVEGSPSLQMVIASRVATYASEFADLDLDLGNPLQDVAGFVVHIGELLDGKPTNHLDLWKGLKKKGRATAPYVCYAVTRPPA